MRKSGWVAAAGLGSLLLLTACGGSSTSNTGLGSTTAATAAPSTGAAGSATAAPSPTVGQTATTGPTHSSSPHATGPTAGPQPSSKVGVSFPPVGTTIMVVQKSDLGFVLDFQKRGGYVQYVSPEMAAYKPDYKSQPEGFWTWGSVIMGGIAYNPKNLAAADAPKKWEDLLDPKLKDGINVKVSNSGLQHGVWYMLKPILGMDYFKKFGEQKPRAFDSYVQQYGRLVDGQDKVIMGAQYSGYIEFIAKGAPLAFVFPETGVPAVSETYGIVADDPHPNAAQLYMDWFLSPIGQQALAEALLLHSPRTDVAAPAGSVPLKDMKLLIPADWNDFEKDRAAFAKEWDRIVGARR